jgi:hypothetical protein
MSPVCHTGAHTGAHCRLAVVRPSVLSPELVLSPESGLSLESVLKS